jgi:outer membrane protein OmpA-like peptidoglycan-associated protein
MMAAVIATGFGIGCTNKPAGANKAVETAKRADGTQPNSSARGSDSTEAGDAIVAAVREKIASDPRITSKDIQVSFQAATPTFQYDTVVLKGSVETEEERTAANNDAVEATDATVSNSIAVRRQTTESTATDAGLAAWSDSGATDKPAIPVCGGLTIVTAIASQGDYESIKTIESANAKEIRVKYSAEVGPRWWTDPRPEAKHLMTAHRTVLTSDLESAHSYDQIFVTSKHSSETVPGNTAIGTSAAVLRELKTKGEAELSICRAAEDTQVMDHDGKLHPGPPGGCYNFSSPIVLKRVGNEPAPLRVLVDGSLVDLPAVQARGETEKEEFFFLDDEKNPLTLAFRLGIGGMDALSPHTRQLCEEAKTKPGLIMTGPVSCDLPHGGDMDTLRVVKITTDCTRPAAASGSGPPPAVSAGALALEKSLAETGKVDVYSLYFAFNSDVIREESGPTLKEIATVLRRHHDWNLRVAGHTDGIGGDEKNLDLSKRRAAAVKNALVKRYGIAANRLSTTGFGKSQPKDTNDTLEGRAHNRRVELSRI